MMMEVAEERELAAAAESEVMVSFLKVEELENHGISRTDVQKLKAA